MTEGLLPPAVAARRLAVSTKTVRRLVERGELDATRIGGQLRIFEDSIAELIERGRVPPIGDAAPAPAACAGRPGVARTAMRAALDGDRRPA